MTPAILSLSDKPNPVLRKVSSCEAQPESQFAPQPAASSIVYKTKLCDFYLQGTCKKAATECNFAHGTGDLREAGAPVASVGVVQSQNTYKTVLCKFYVEGTCKKGVECQFAHSNRDLRA